MNKLINNINRYIKYTPGTYYVYNTIDMKLILYYAYTTL